MLRLPPHNIVIPTIAMFRDDPLPQELWETWSLLRALAWVNKYEFTPPMTIRELLDLHNQRKKTPIKKRALQTRLERLKDMGWLEIRLTGRGNIFVPIVPPTTPAMVQAAARREPASVTLPHFDEADSPRMSIADEDSAFQDSRRDATPLRENLLHNVVVPDHDNLDLKQQHPIGVQPNCTPAMQLDCTSESMKILHQAGVEGRNLEMLAATVMPNVARRWAEWVPVAPHSFKDPVGYLVRRLLNDPNAEPPRVRGSVRGKTVSEVLAELRDKLQAEAEDAEDTEESF